MKAELSIRYRGKNLDGLEVVYVEFESEKGTAVLPLVNEPGWSLGRVEIVESLLGDSEKTEVDLVYSASLKSGSTIYKIVGTDFEVSFRN